MDDSTDIAGNGAPPWDADSAEAPGLAELEDAGQGSMFGAAPAPAPAPPAAKVPADPAQPYRVLARKYRPRTFGELIGQEPMVRTLANAIRRDRLAHAFLMTGVRGVGKTSTARLIAKALNCIGPDGKGGPTIDPCGVCEPCRAIAEGRHIDVIEMDAASHTGVDDVREIIEAVRYAAVSARYKIYIVDEVHMLSRNAFNALLKTLEEPPAHVKFLFATTEVDKLPVTVLSRTQRFDLRRIPAAMLAEHFASVCRQEGVGAEEEALGMIAAAAEGSVRDGLSILDQAIAHADMGDDARVTALRVRDMLGLADKSMQRRLLDAVLKGDGPSVLEIVGDQYALGVEPLALMRGQMDLVHRTTVAQLGGGGADGASEDERAAIADWGARLNAGQLHRLWQLLLKGYEEVANAPDPLASVEMALLRVLYAADLPDPGKLAARIEMLADRSAPPDANVDTPASRAASSPDWAGLCDLVENEGFLVAAQMMRGGVRVIALDPGHLVFSAVPGHAVSEEDMRDALSKATRDRWLVERGDAEGEPSLRERDDARAKENAARLRAHPLVAAAFAAFPDAEMLDEEERGSLADNSRKQMR